MNNRPAHLARFCKEKDIEERKMLYVDHPDSLNMECGSYIKPGLLITDTLQITVNKKCKGEKLTAGHFYEKKL
jgi:hypothetical protein